MPKSERCRILHLEDNELDRELVRQALNVQDLEVEVTYAATEGEFVQAFKDATFDLVLSDFTLPGYGGAAALEYVRAQLPELPFIFVSGTIGEKRAIECLKSGATDYILKDDPRRLLPAIRHAVREAREHARRREAESALRESEQRHRLLFERNPQPMWMYDRETLRFLDVNEAAIRHYGWTREEFLAMTIVEIRPVEDVPALRAIVQSAPRGFLLGESWRHCRKDGSLIDVEIAAHDVPFGERPARLVMVNDVTERKRAVVALERERERFAAIFQSSPVGIAYGTAEGRMAEVNPQLCEIFGYSREELVGRTTQELNIWARPEQREAAYAKLRADKTLRNFEVKLRRKSGEIRTGLLSIETLQLGVEPLLLAMVVDITERKELEGELLRANRVQSVGRLASGIAHDLNNILAPIMMAAPILRMNLAPTETEKTLTTIELSAVRGADLVKRLLTFGRGVEGERGPVQLGGLIQEVVKIGGETFPKKILLRSQVAAGTWAVRGDVSQLHQVLLNLIVNARDAMPNGGTLTVEARNVRLDENFTATHPDVRPGNFVRLSVTDTGIGIPPEIVDKIFDPFFTTKAIGQGTGLGLSTVLGIVKSHDGLITVHSEENVGTTFEIYLPAMAAEMEIAAPSASAPPRGSNELVLLVDDEPNIRTMVQKALSAHNYRVLVASDGAEASAVFARNISEIKLVITDLDMPYMNGLSLARTLQRMKPDIKILVSSGLGSAKDAKQWGAELAALGIPPILPKPYSTEVLLITLKRLLTDGGGDATEAEATTG